MNGEERRSWIIKLLESTSKPISATSIAKQVGVSRQVIVGDIALLRASGEDIEATPRGYHKIKKTTNFCILIACCHEGMDQLQQELYLLVDYGAIIENVIVENPLYGQITAPLNISNRYEADLFLKKAENMEDSLLSNLTDGVHLHRIQCKEKENAEKIKIELRKRGILYQAI